MEKNAPTQRDKERESKHDVVRESNIEALLIILCSLSLYFLANKTHGNCMEVASKSYFVHMKNDIQLTDVFKALVQRLHKHLRKKKAMGKYDPTSLEIPIYADDVSRSLQ